MDEFEKNYVIKVDADLTKAKAAIDGFKDDFKDLMEDNSKITNVPNVDNALTADVQRAMEAANYIEQLITKAQEASKGQRSRIQREITEGLRDLDATKQILQLGNQKYDMVGVNMARSMFSGFSAQVQRELAAVTPQIMNSIRTEFRKTSGTSLSFGEIAEQIIGKNRNTAMMANLRKAGVNEDEIRQFVKILTPSAINLNRTAGYQEKRYKTVSSTPVLGTSSYLPNNMLRQMWENGGYQRGVFVDPKAGDSLYLNRKTMQHMARMVSSNPAAYRAAQAAGLIHYTGDKYQRLSNNITANQYDAYMEALWKDLEARAQGMPSRHIDFYSKELSQEDQSRLNSRMMSGTTGQVLDALWMSSSLIGPRRYTKVAPNVGARLYGLPKHNLEQYEVNKYTLDDIIKKDYSKPQKIALSESLVTRELGYQGKHNQALNEIVEVNLGGYNKDDSAQRKMLRTLLGGENGKGGLRIGKNIYDLVNIHGTGQDTVGRFMLRKSKQEIQERYRKTAAELGLAGTDFFKLFTADNREFETVEDYARYLDATGKMFSPGSQGYDLSKFEWKDVNGKRQTGANFAFVNFKNLKNQKLADGIAWVIDSLIPHEGQQSRFALAGKGMVQSLHGAKNIAEYARNAGILEEITKATGLKEQELENIHGLFDVSTIKNMAAFDNLSSVKSRNNALTALVRMFGQSDMKSSVETEAQGLGGQAMQFLDMPLEMIVENAQRAAKQISQLQTDVGARALINGSRNGVARRALMNNDKQVAFEDTQRMVDNEIDSIIRRINKGEYIEFDKKNSIKNLRLNESLISAALALNEKNPDEIRNKQLQNSKIANNKKLTEYVKNLSADDIMGIFAQKSGTGQDFTTDEDTFSVNRAPTAVGQFLGNIKNYAKKALPIYKALGINTTGAYLNYDDMQKLSGADLDGDTVKAVYGQMAKIMAANAEEIDRRIAAMGDVNTPRSVVTNPNNGARFTDNVDMRENYVIQANKSGLYMGRQDTAAARATALGLSKAQNLRIAYESAQGYAEAADSLKKGTDVYLTPEQQKLVKMGKPWTRFAQGFTGLFNVTGMDNQPIPKEIFTSSIGNIRINMDQLRAMNLSTVMPKSVHQSSNLTSVLLAGMLGGYGVNTGYADAQLDAYSKLNKPMDESRPELKKAQELRDSYVKMLSYSMIGAYGIMPREDMERFRNMREEAAHEIESYAEKKRGANGLIDYNGKSMSSDSFIKALQKEYAMPGVDIMLSQIGFTQENVDKVFNGRITREKLPHLFNSLFSSDMPVRSTAGFDNAVADMFGFQYAVDVARERLRAIQRNTPTINSISSSVTSVEPWMTDANGKPLRFNGVRYYGPNVIGDPISIDMYTEQDMMKYREGKQRDTIMRQLGRASELKMSASAGLGNIMHMALENAYSSTASVQPSVIMKELLSGDVSGKYTTNLGDKDKLRLSLEAQRAEKLIEENGNINESSISEQAPKLSAQLGGGNQASTLDEFFKTTQRFTRTKGSKKPTFMPEYSFDYVDEDILKATEGYNERYNERNAKGQRRGTVRVDLVRIGDNGDVTLFDYKSSIGGAKESIGQLATYAAMMEKMSQQYYALQKKYGDRTIGSGDKDYNEYQYYQNLKKNNADKWGYYDNEGNFVSRIKRLVGADIAGRQGYTIDLTTPEGREAITSGWNGYIGAIYARKQDALAGDPQARIKLLKSEMEREQYELHNPVMASALRQEFIEELSNQYIKESKESGKGIEISPMLAQQAAKDDEVYKQINSQLAKKQRQISKAPDIGFSMFEAMRNQINNETQSDTQLAKLLADAKQKYGDDSEEASYFRNMQIRKDDALNRINNLEREAVPADIAYARDSLRRAAQGTHENELLKVYSGMDYRYRNAKSEVEAQKNQKYFETIDGVTAWKSDDESQKQKILYEQSVKDLERMNREMDKYKVEATQRHQTSEQKQLAKLLKDPKTVSSEDKIREYFSNKREAIANQILQYNEDVKSFNEKIAKGEDVKLNRKNKKATTEQMNEAEQYLKSGELEKQEEEEIRQNTLQDKQNRVHALMQLQAARNEADLDYQQQNLYREQYALNHMRRTTIPFVSHSLLGRNFSNRLQQNQETKQQQIRFNSQIKNLKIAQTEESANLAMLKSTSREGKTEDQIGTQNAQIATSQQKIENYANRIKYLKSNLDQLGKENTSDLGAALASGFDTATQAVERLVSRLGRQVLYKAINEAKRFVLEFSSEMSQIQAITQMSDEQMVTERAKNISQAKSLHTSVSNVASTRAALYRQGLSGADVDERTEDIIKFATVTGVKVTDATKYLTTAVKTGLVASVEEAMDVLVALGDTAATTAEEISKGMQKSAAAAKNAGVSYEELSAMLTIITSKTQLGGNQAGTALQTLFSRMTRVTKTGSVTDSSGHVTTINDVEKALNAIGINLRNPENPTEIRSSYDVLYELSQRWNNLNDIQKGNVTYAMAGGRQVNMFTSLMEGFAEDNGESLKEMMDQIENGNASGITETKYEIAIKNINTALTDLKTNWDSVVATLTENGTINGVLDIANNFVTGIQNATESLGPLGVAIAGITTLIAAMVVKLGAAYVLKEGLTEGWAGLVAAGVALTALLAGTQIVYSSGKNDNQNQKQQQQSKSDRTSQINRYTEIIDVMDKRIEAIKKGQSIVEDWSNGIIDSASAAESLKDELKDLSGVSEELDNVMNDNSSTVEDYAETLGKLGQKAEEAKTELTNLKQEIMDVDLKEEFDEMNEEISQNNARKLYAPDQTQMAGFYVAGNSGNATRNGTLRDLWALPDLSVESKYKYTRRYMNLDHFNELMAGFISSNMYASEIDFTDSDFVKAFFSGELTEEEKYSLLEKLIKKKGLNSPADFQKFWKWINNPDSAKAIEKELTDYMINNAQITLADVMNLDKFADVSEIMKSVDMSFINDEQKKAFYADFSSWWNNHYGDMNENGEFKYSALQGLNFDPTKPASEWPQIDELDSAYREMLSDYLAYDHTSRNAEIDEINKSIVEDQMKQIVSTRYSYLTTAEQNALVRQQTEDYMTNEDGKYDNKDTAYAALIQQAGAFINAGLEIEKGDYPYYYLDENGEQQGLEDYEEFLKSVPESELEYWKKRQYNKSTNQRVFQTYGETQSGIYQNIKNTNPSALGYKDEWKKVNKIAKSVSSMDEFLALTTGNGFDNLDEFLTDNKELAILWEQARTGDVSDFIKLQNYIEQHINGMTSEAKLGQLLSNRNEIAVHKGIVNRIKSGNLSKADVAKIASEYGITTEQYYAEQGMWNGLYQQRVAAEEQDNTQELIDYAVNNGYWDEKNGRWNFKADKEILKYLMSQLTTKVHTTRDAETGKIVISGRSLEAKKPIESEDITTSAALDYDVQQGSYWRNLAQSVLEAGSVEAVNETIKEAVGADNFDTTMKQLKSIYPDLFTWINMDEKQKASTEGQNLKRNIEIAFNVTGLEEQEKAGKVISGFTGYYEQMKSANKLTAFQGAEGVRSNVSAAQTATAAVNKLKSGKTLTESEWNAIAQYTGVSDISEFQNGTRLTGELINLIKDTTSMNEVSAFKSMATEIGMSTADLATLLRTDKESVNQNVLNKYLSAGYEITEQGGFRMKTTGLTTAEMLSRNALQRQNVYSLEDQAKAFAGLEKFETMSLEEMKAALQTGDTYMDQANQLDQQFEGIENIQNENEFRQAVRSYTNVTRTLGTGSTTYGQKYQAKMAKDYLDKVIDRGVTEEEFFKGMSYNQIEQIKNSFGGVGQLLDFVGEEGEKEKLRREIEVSIALTNADMFDDLTNTLDQLSKGGMFKLTVQMEAEQAAEQLGQFGAAVAAYEAGSATPEQVQLIAQQIGWSTDKFYAKGGEANIAINKYVKTRATQYEHDFQALLDAASTPEEIADVEELIKIYGGNVVEEGTWFDNLIGKKNKRTVVFGENFLDNIEKYDIDNISGLTKTYRSEELAALAQLVIDAGDKGAAVFESLDDNAQTALLSYGNMSEYMYDQQHETDNLTKSQADLAQTIQDDVLKALTEEGSIFKEMASIIGEIRSKSAIDSTKGVQNAYTVATDYASYAQAYNRIMSGKGVKDEDWGIVAQYLNIGSDMLEQYKTNPQLLTQLDNANPEINEQALNSVETAILEQFKEEYGLEFSSQAEFYAKNKTNKFAKSRSRKMDSILAAYKEQGYTFDEYGRIGYDAELASKDFVERYRMNMAIRNSSIDAADYTDSYKQAYQYALEAGQGLDKETLLLVLRNLGNSLEEQGLLDIGSMMADDKEFWDLTTYEDMMNYLFTKGYGAYAQYKGGIYDIHNSSVQTAQNNLEKGIIDQEALTKSPALQTYLSNIIPNWDNYVNKIIDGKGLSIDDVAEIKATREKLEGSIVSSKKTYGNKKLAEYAQKYMDEVLTGKKTEQLFQQETGMDKDSNLREQFKSAYGNRLDQLANFIGTDEEKAQLERQIMIDIAFADKDDYFNLQNMLEQLEKGGMYKLTVQMEMAQTAESYGEFGAAIKAFENGEATQEQEQLIAQTFKWSMPKFYQMKDEGKVLPFAKTYTEALAKQQTKDYQTMYDAANEEAKADIEEAIKENGGTIVEEAPKTIMGQLLGIFGVGKKKTVKFDSNFINNIPTYTEDPADSLKRKYSDKEQAGYAQILLNAGNNWESVWTNFGPELQNAILGFGEAEQYVYNLKNGLDDAGESAAKLGKKITQSQNAALEESGELLSGIASALDDLAGNNEEKRVKARYTLLSSYLNYSDARLAAQRIKNNEALPEDTSTAFSYLGMDQTAQKEYWNGTITADDIYNDISAMEEQAATDLESALLTQFNEESGTNLDLRTFRIWRLFSGKTRDWFDNAVKDYNYAGYYYDKDRNRIGFNESLVDGSIVSRYKAEQKMLEATGENSVYNEQLEKAYRLASIMSIYKNDPENLLKFFEQTGETAFANYLNSDNEFKGLQARIDAGEKDVLAGYFWNKRYGGGYKSGYYNANNEQVKENLEMLLGGEVPDLSNNPTLEAYFKSIFPDYEDYRYTFANNGSLTPAQLRDIRQQIEYTQAAEAEKRGEVTAGTAENVKTVYGTDEEAALNAVFGYARNMSELADAETYLKRYKADREDYSARSNLASYLGVDETRLKTATDDEIDEWFEDKKKRVNTALSDFMKQTFDVDSFLNFESLEGQVSADKQELYNLVVSVFDMLGLAIDAGGDIVKDKTFDLGEELNKIDGSEKRRTESNLQKLYEFALNPPEVEQPETGAQKFGLAAIAGSKPADLEDYLDFTDDEWQDILQTVSGNTDAVEAIQALRERRPLTDIQMAALRDASEYYNAITRDDKYQLGEDYFESLFGEHAVEQMMTGSYEPSEVLLKNKNLFNDQTLLGIMSLYGDEGSEFMEIFTQLQNGTIDIKDATEAFQKLGNTIRKTSDDEAKKFGKSTKSVTEDVKKLNGTLSEQVEVQKKFNSNAERINNNQILRNKWRSGNKDSDVLDYVAGVTNISKKAQQSGQYDKSAVDKLLGLDEALDIETAQDDLQARLQSFMDVQNANIAGTEFKLDDIQIVDGQVQTPNFSNLGEAEAAVSAAFAEFAAALAQYRVTGVIDVETMDNAITALMKVTGLTGGGNYTGGGGGGGGGKSATDKLIEKLKNQLGDMDHKIKMVQYAETKYQNRGELTNYGNALKQELVYQKQRKTQLENNISELRKHMGTLSSSSDEWRKAFEELKKYEEQLAETNNTIEENVKKQRENKLAILQTRTAIEKEIATEMENAEQKRRNMLSSTVQMEDQILETIRQRYQKEWELVEKDIEKKRDALNEEMQLIDERLQRRKEAADEAEKYEELAELQSQLAVISMDPTRTKDAAELRERISELEKEIGWDIADKQAEVQKESLQEQIDAYDEYIRKGTEDLQKYLEDANNFKAEVDKIMSGSKKEIIKWLRENNEEWKNATENGRKNLEESWTDMFESMKGILINYWKEITKLLTGSEEEYLKYMKGTDTYKNASEAERKTLVENWKKLWEDMHNATKNDHNDDSHNDNVPKGSGTNNNGSNNNGGNSNYKPPADDKTDDKTDEGGGTDENWFKKGIKSFIGGINKIVNGGSSGINTTAYGYDSGGLVNYTGVAQVHGSKTRPEAFQDADDTRLMRNMLDSMSTVNMPNFWSMIDSAKLMGNIQTIGDINIEINEASFKDDADLDEVAYELGNRFVKELGKQGMVMANYNF